MSNQIEEQAESTGQIPCQTLPNDTEDHYWIWHHDPQSVPTDFRRCNWCGRIDASEAFSKQKENWEKEAEKKARTDEHVLVYRKARNLDPEEFLAWSDNRIRHLNPSNKPNQNKESE